MRLVPVQSAQVDRLSFLYKVINTFPNITTIIQKNKTILQGLFLQALHFKY